MSTRTERAQALREQIASYLENGVTVTLDARDLDKRGAGKSGVIVLIAPAPRFDFPQPLVTRLEWAVYILTDPTGVPIDDLEPVDQVMDALIASDLTLTSAEPGSYPRTDPAPDMQGYVVTVQDDYLY